MNTHTLRLITIALLALIVATRKVSTATAATVTPRAALLDRLNVARVEHGLHRVYRECGHYHGYTNACIWTADWLTRS